MFCTKCGTQLADGARFCKNCGAPVDAARTGAGAGPGTGAGTGTGVGSGVGMGIGGGVVVSRPVLFTPLARIAVGALSLFNAVCYFNTLNDYSDRFETYLDIYEEAEALGLALAWGFPLVMIVLGLAYLADGLRQFLDRPVSERVAKRWRPQTGVLDGALMFAMMLVCKIFAETYEFDWGNAVAVHTVWWVLSMYEEEIMFTLLLWFVYAIVSVFLVYLEGSGSKTIK